MPQAPQDNWKAWLAARTLLATDRRAVQALAFRKLAKHEGLQLADVDRQIELFHNLSWMAKDLIPLGNVDVDLIESKTPIRQEPYQVGLPDKLESYVVFLSLAEKRGWLKGANGKQIAVAKDNWPTYRAVEILPTDKGAPRLVLAKGGHYYEYFNTCELITLCRALNATVQIQAM